MTYAELKGLHDNLKFDNLNLPSFAAFKRAKKEGRLVATHATFHGKAVIVGKDEGKWQWTMDDEDYYGMHPDVLSCNDLI